MSDALVGAQHVVPLSSRLEAYYLSIDKDFQITNFTPISDGWETEVYAFDLTLRHQTEPCILRMYPGENAAAKCHREWRAFRDMMAFRYSVPRVYRSETDTVWLGKPFLVMQRINGRPLGDVMREDTARQPELLSRFVKLAVDLHQQHDYRPEIDVFIEHDPAVFTPITLERWRTHILTDLQQAWAAPIFDWLEANKVPESEVLSPLHRDFHPHNVLITPDDQLYVIDWSGFSIGDYRYDLAWTLLLISSSGYPQLRDLILSEYARLAGHPVANIAYFDVLAALRRLVDLAASLGSGAESLGMRPETVAIMRTQQDRYQYVYTLLHDRTSLRVPYLEALIASLSA